MKKLAGILFILIPIENYLLHRVWSLLELFDRTDDHRLDSAGC
jgi:hypothetical protein